jgi:hypothetical protein
MRRKVQMKILHSIYYFTNRDVDAYYDGEFVCESDLKRIAIMTFSHIYWSMKGPERLALKTKCLICGDWAHMKDGEQYEFVASLHHKERSAKMIGNFCTKCMSQPRIAKDAAVAVQVKGERPR